MSSALRVISDEHEEVEVAFDDDDEEEEEEEEVLSCDVYETATGDDDVTRRAYCMREPPDWHAGNYRIRGPICDTLEVLAVSASNPKWISRGSVSLNPGQSLTAPESVTPSLW